eukprot:CAMPEP_0182858094 /NCGR_PEP_ID=MMETSP0034_2-20130328/3459_1 /TAXON_ID=156128 /ORGANISM="Nephroselmis pyriformis, Strain CCMP717" /LENGTH=133 /DNA_ID=CAMNT_0024989443 /DNA_START=233 /DNA_END=634 /DNA_ORIENTATION=-
MSDSPRRTIPLATVLPPAPLPRHSLSALSVGLPRPRRARASVAVLEGEHCTDGRAREGNAHGRFALAGAGPPRPPGPGARIPPCLSPRPRAQVLGGGVAGDLAAVRTGGAPLVHREAAAGGYMKGVSFRRTAE